MYKRQSEDVAVASCVSGKWPWFDANMMSVDDRVRVAVDPWCRPYSLGFSSRNPCPVPAVWVDAAFVLGPAIYAADPVHLVAPALVDGDADGDEFRLP